MKHDISEKTRGIQDQQTAIQTAIESQTKTIVSTISTVQKSVANMSGEMRDLREDLEALRRIRVDFSATNTAIDTLEHEKDFENKNRGLEVVRRYQHNGNTAGTFKSTRADFTASSASHNVHSQDRRGNCGGTAGSTIPCSSNCNCGLITSEISPEIKPDARVLYIVNGSNTTDLGYETPGQGLVGSEVGADGDMTDVIDGSTISAPHPQRSSGTEYQNGSESISFPSSQRKLDIKGKGKALAARLSSRSSHKKRQTSLIRLNTGHSDGDRTAKIRKDTARIKKRLDKSHEAELRRRKWKDIKASDRMRAQTPEKGGIGSVRPEPRRNETDEEGASSVENPRDLIRDPETNSMTVKSAELSGRHNHFDSHESNLFPAQGTDSSPLYIGVSSTPARSKVDHENLGTFEASGDFTSAAVTQIKKCQEDSQIHESDDASEGSDRSFSHASEVTRDNAAEDLPSQSTSVAPATEEVETRPLASSYSNNFSSESLSDDSSHTTFGKNRAIVMVLEGFGANSCENSDARYMSSEQSQDQMQSSEDTDDMYYHAIYEIGGQTAAERKTSDNDDGTTSPLLADLRTEQKVYRDQDALQEGLRSRAKDPALREQPGAIPGEVTREGVQKTLGSFETNKMVMRQLLHKVGKPDHDENSETLISGEHRLHQMTSRSDECGHHSDIADPSVVHSFDEVTSGAQGSRQSDNRTSDWTKNPESDLKIAPVTKLPQSNDSSQGVTENGHYDSLEVGLKGDRSVTTPPLGPPVCNQGLETVAVDNLPSSTVDEQNGSGISDYTEEDIGVARDLTYVSEDQPQLPTSILPPPDIALPTSPSRPIEALLSTESRETGQESSQRGTDPNVCPSKRRDEDDSAGADHLLENIRSDHAASSLLGEPRGQKRSGVMPDRFYKEKRPKLPDDDNPETTTTCPSENGRNESAVALLEPSARISGKGISTSLQNNEPVTGATPGSSDIEMTDSCTLLDQNLGSKSVNRTVIESDPEKSTKLGVATSEPATGRWKALIEQRRREREDGRRKTRYLREAMKRDQRKRENGHAAVSLEDTLFVPPDETSRQFEHGEPFEIDTKTGTSTNLEDRDKQRLPGSSSQGIFVVEEESGVNIHESSPDQQHVVTSQIHSAATTGRPAAMAGHTNSQLDSIQPSSDEYGGLQSVDPVNIEVVKTIQPPRSSGILSQNPLSGSSAANGVSSLAHKENTQQVLEPNSSTIVGHVDVFDDFSQTVPELKSDNIAWKAPL
jgi:hypothetical protein